MINKILSSISRYNKNNVVKIEQNQNLIQKNQI